MNKELLNQFFDENTVEDGVPTAPSLMHFHITLDANPKSNEELLKTINNIVFKSQPEREEKAQAERDNIESATTGAQIVKFMRQKTDPANDHILLNKAMEFEEDILPELIRMMRTSLSDIFIEKAARVLARSGEETAEKLIGYFDEIRSPYAQSIVLVALGFLADEKNIPWLIEKYKELKRIYPNESYCEGAYYALYEIENRFYPVG